jgi:AraC-like DNA-binding protein
MCEKWSAFWVGVTVVCQFRVCEQFLRNRIRDYLSVIHFCPLYLLSISEEILYFVCGFGILQGMLLAALVYFHPKADRSVNTFLALHLFFQSILMGFPFILELVSWKNSFFIQPLPLLVGPLLYFYIQSFKGKITWQKALPHLIPFFLFFFVTYWNIESMIEKYPDAEEFPTEALNRPVTKFLMYVRLAHLMVYYFLSRQALISYQKSIEHIFSETSRINLRWAKVLVNGYLFLLICSVVIFQLMFRFPEYFNLLLLINMAAGTPYMYVATIKGISQSTLWQTQPGIKKEVLEEELREAEETEKIKSGASVRPAKTGLNSGRIEEIARRITHLMENEKLYQETELTVQQLASKLELPTYQVSQAINEGLKRNFYELVNAYRVEEAKQLLLDPNNRNYTILSVGFEAGFNSKTTFNTIFKKFTGLTPTEFRAKGS